MYFLERSGGSGRIRNCLILRRFLQEMKIGIRKICRHLWGFKGTICQVFLSKRLILKDMNFAYSVGWFVFDSGGIKPCVAAFGGDQFSENEESKLGSFFSLFYFAINAGSVLSMLITPYLRGRWYVSLSMPDPFYLCSSPLTSEVRGTFLYQCRIYFIRAHHPLPQR